MGTPSSPNQLTTEAIRLLKAFEGLYLRAYQDSVGVWTIGYGTTAGVRSGMVISEAEAEALLRKDLDRFEGVVRSLVTVPLTDDQYSALVVFAYNVGDGALGGSTLRKRLNGGDYGAAADEFLRWDKAGGRSLLGLSRRRRAERALFLGEPWEGFLTWEPSAPADLAQGAGMLRLTVPPMGGDRVRQVQRALGEAGFSVAIDGLYGPGTAAAVRQFQGQRGLVADGVVGAETLAALGL